MSAYERIVHGQGHLDVGGILASDLCNKLVSTHSIQCGNLGVRLRQ